MTASQGLDQTPTDAEASLRDKLYRAAWRWHFYAGLFVIPFFAILAITGLAMLWIAWIDGRDGERVPVSPRGAPAAVSAQADAAVAAVPGGVLIQYVAPRTDDVAAIFRVDAGGDAVMVVVDPYRAEVLETFSRRSGWYDLADSIHGDLMLGVLGDRMLEIAASLGMVLIATGLYLWRPRRGSARAALVPSLRGRGWWKSTHRALGVWMSLFLAFFLVSGLAWAGIWGERFVQAWSQFPAEKWDAVPLSDATHASMNHDRQEAPWALAQTPMPASGGLGGEEGLAPGTPITIDTIDALARQIGFDARYQLNLPRGEDGVWTLSRDSMSTDSLDPTADRTTHVDQYTGRILADVRFEDYSLAGQAMAVGIALHMGTLGLWSVLANTVICLSVLFFCVSAVVMWRRRRPAGGFGLAAPPAPKDMPLWRGAVLVGLAISLAFPLAGLTLLAVLTIDTLIVARSPFLRRAID